MLGRILVATLVLGLAAVSIPGGDFAPADSAAAICYYVEPFGCLPNPACLLTDVVEKVTGRPAGCLE